MYLYGVNTCRFRADFNCFHTEEDDIILDDQTRTRAEVGKRLTKIGDGIEAKRRETSSASENESQSTSGERNKKKNFFSRYPFYRPENSRYTL